MSPRRIRMKAASRAGSMVVRARGFTLIELLIVMALIIIMFVMLYGSGSKSFQRKQKAACQKNLELIYVALQIYGNDHAGAYPLVEKAASSEAPLSLLIPRYTSLTAPFICPGTKEPPLPEGEPFQKRRISYAYYMGRRAGEATEVLLSDQQINTSAKIQSQPLFSADGKKPGNNHHRYGGNLLFGDGHMEMTGVTAPRSLLLPDGVVLLNPKS